MTKIVIIGSGLAGYVLAKELRQASSHCQLVMITQDDGEYYTKPSLSQVYGAGKSPDALIMKHAQEMAASLDMQIITRSKVTEINREERQVGVETGQEFTYDYLVLAIGAKPISPGGIHYDALPFVVNSLRDLSQLYQHVDQKNGLVAVLGAGLVGTEFAYDLSHKVQELDWVYSEPWPLSRFVPEEVGLWLLAQMHARGIHSRHEQVRKVSRGVNDCFEIQTDKGSHVYQTVLQAFGLGVSCSILTKAGIVCDRGVCTDAFLKTSADCVYAMGDCAQVNGVQLQYVAPIRVQAKALAGTLLGEPQAVSYPAMATLVKTPKAPVCFSIPPNLSDQLDWVVEKKDDAGVCCFAYLAGDLVGFALAGDQAGQRAQLIKKLPAWLA